MNKLCLLIILVFLIACNSSNNYNIPKNNSSTIKLFEDANEIQRDWSNKNSIITHVISEPDNLHPTNGNSSPRSDILQYTQRTILYIDYSNQTLVPGLVKTLPEISDDGLKYSYTLKENIKWDDGSLLTPKDIAFTARAFLCPMTNDPSVRFYWENIENILLDSTQSGKFTIVMKKKHIQNITFLTGFPILQQSFHDPENILSTFTFNQFNDTSFQASGYPGLVKWANEFNDDSYGRDPKKLNGLGMYSVSEWKNGQYITLTRKKNHWSQHSSDYHELSFPEKIIFKLNKDEASQLLEFKSQVMDVSTNISVTNFLQLYSDDLIRKNYNQAMMPTYNYTYLCFNEKPDGKNRKKLFDDVNVRRAFAMLTPVQNIIQLVYKQYSDQCYQVTSNVSPLKKELNHDLKVIPFNLKEAEKILLKAGWIDSDNDGILDKIINGKKISLIADLNYLSSSQEWKNIAMLIAEEMAKAGIQINPVGMEIKLFLEKAKSHDFDLMLGSWGGSSLPEDYTQLWHSTSWTNHGSNYSGFGNAYSDALIDSIKHELNDTLRFKLSRKLQKEIYNDQPYVFLYSSLRRNIIHKRFANQMVFSEKPGILINMLRLLSINKGITITDETTP